MDIPIVVDLDIHEFSGSGITDYSSGLTNLAFHKKQGKWKLTQRSSIDVTEDASSIVGLTNRARGIYYWEAESNLFIVNDDTVYEQTQDGGEVDGGSEISTGTERVTFVEMIGTQRLVILDAENNEGWVVNSPASSVTAIASNFPSTLCHGGCVLDGYLCVMDETGILYNSDLDDPTTFSALAFKKAERDNDKGVYLGKHNEHVVAFGTRTIEFFYDDGTQPSQGSMLQRRQDIMHNIGCADGLGVWENGDVTFFVGSNPDGQLAVYRLENFEPVMVSNDTLNSYLTQAITQESLRIILSGWSAMGQTTLIMTIYTLTGASPGLIDPKISISYNSVSGLWGFINTSVNSHTYFPVMAWTKRTGGQNATESARSGEGIFHNGDIFVVTDKLTPVDTLLGSSVYVLGVYEPDVYAQSTDVGANISAIIRTGDVDGGIHDYKFQAREYLMMDTTSTSQTVTVRHADEGTTTFTTGNTINTSYDKKEVWQGGRFWQRNYQLEYSGDEQIFINSFGADLEAGT